MAKHLYIWSDKPNPKWYDKIFSNRFSANEAAVDEQGNTMNVVQVASNADLLKVLRELSDPVDLMELYTHGGPGLLQLGSEGLWPADLKVHEMHGYDGAFNGGATITLSGCNCAEGAEGELLLVQFARTFLRSGGGQVTGNTSAGWVLSFLGPFFFLKPYTVYHPFGHWVSATATAGGAVALSNEFYLNLDNINERIAEIQLAIDHADPKVNDVDSVKDELETAKRYVPPLAAWEFWNLWEACNHLQNAETIINQQWVIDRDQQWMWDV
jgi:hypothetical protein